MKPTTTTAAAAATAAATATTVIESSEDDAAMRSGGELPPQTASGDEEEEEDPEEESSVVRDDDRRKRSFEYTKSVLLGKVIKTTLSDGRTLTGTFMCIDRLKNLILTDVTEERYIDPSDYRYRVGDDDDHNDDDDARTGGNDDETGEKTAEEEDRRMIRVERRISQAMIPGARLVKAEISRSSLDENPPSEDDPGGGVGEETQ
mmetsp:Transcript_10389/g.25132  ORF Transcript_10389/g.25132 Transcript_10389/m.25132 type:complete len:204 (-) Transcript_10389:149-760(-)